jgi:hypothetical protein
MSKSLIEQVQSLLHTVDWDPNASDTEIMQCIDWEGLRSALDEATADSGLDSGSDA